MATRCLAMAAVGCGEATVAAVYPDARNPFAHPELLAEEGLEPWAARELWLMAAPDERIDHIVDVCNAGTAWSRDGRYLFYVTADEQERPHRVWRHEVGAGPSGAVDTLIFEEDDERYFVGIGETRSDDYVVIQSASRLLSWRRSAMCGSENSYSGDQKSASKGQTSTQMPQYMQSAKSMSKRSSWLR